MRLLDTVEIVTAGLLVLSGGCNLVLLYFLVRNTSDLNDIRSTNDRILEKAAQVDEQTRLRYASVLLEEKSE